MFAVLPLFFVLLLPSASYGAATEEYDKIQQRMDEQKKKLSEVQQREHSILRDIEEVNIKLGTIESELGRYRKNLSKTEGEIARTNAEIDRTSAGIDRQKNFLKKRLRTIHRYGYSGDAVTLLMSSTELPQAMRTVKYLESIARYEHRLLLEYKSSIEKLNADRARLQTLRAELKSHTEKIKAKEGELATRRKSKEVILNSVRQEKATRQKMLAELKEASRKMLAIIRESSKSDAYSASGFGKLKGRLHWPVDGRIAIPYGSQRDPQFDTPIFRNGVHIKAASSADIRSVYSGKVIFAEWFKGFGQLLIVNHGGSYHTLYGNLAEIFSKVGDIIRENQVIGKAGTSGVMDSPGLYFEIRYKGKPLDPAQWLKGRRN
ncbi:MAG: peptidoglycan DD-metalloendopeptidase family protein [Nitrospirae bacterium]|nr:peptidoglycan DD-metalloendopeptidase family protein [Nitrospirota bacterium]